MHSSGFQTGTLSEMFRFSHRAVAGGYVPSTGNALTGSSLPRPAIIMAVTCLTKSGACAGTRGIGSRVLVAAAGSTTSCRFSKRAIDSRKIALDQFLPFASVGRLDGILDLCDRFVAGQHA